MDLLQDRAAKVTLTADTAPERPHLPLTHTLEDDLLLADRGYVDGCVESRIFGEQADAMVAIVVKETVQGGGWVCGQSSACRSSMALW